MLTPSPRSSSWRCSARLGVDVPRLLPLLALLLASCTAEPPPARSPDDGTLPGADLADGPSGADLGAPDACVAPSVGARTLRRFGVDGADPRYFETIAALGDGSSSLNGLTWQRFEPEAPRGAERALEPRLSGTVTAGLMRMAELGRTVQINLRPRNQWAIAQSPTAAIDPSTGESAGRLVRIRPEYLDAYQGLFPLLLALRPGVITALQVDSEAENEWEGWEGYLEAVCEAHAAIRQAAPEVLVLAGGFNPGEFFAQPPEVQEALLAGPNGQAFQRKLDFWRGFFAGARDCFDVLTVHLNRSPEDIAPTVRWFAAEMERSGYRKPIWGDDFSSGRFILAPSASSDELEWLAAMEAGDRSALARYKQEQAGYLVRKLATAFAEGLERVYLSSDVDWSDYFMPAWRHMGLLDTEGEPHPAYHTFRMLIGKADGFEHAAWVEDGVVAFSWGAAPALFIAWADTVRTLDLSARLGCARAKVTRVIDSPGQVEPIEEQVESTAIPLGPVPVFIEPAVP